MDSDALFDAYINYSHEDFEVVKELAQRLKSEAKLNVWLDKWELAPGENWQKQMEEGLTHTRSVIVCIGSNTPKGWFKEEIQNALNRQLKDPSFRVIPVLLPNSNEGNLDESFELRTWIDFRNGIDDTPFHALVCGIKGMASGSSQEEIAQERNPELIRMKKKLEELRELEKAGLIDETLRVHLKSKLIQSYLSILEENKGK